MTYDPEKYREKREKVLGVKQRGISFGTLSLIAALVIIAGLSAVTVPQAVSTMVRRNLDDAIFKLESASAWPQEALDSIASMDGVTAFEAAEHTTRLVVTYDRRKLNADAILAEIERHSLSVTLLNHVRHLQHKATLDEEKDH